MLKANTSPRPDLYPDFWDEVATQDICVFTSIPDWVTESDVPKVGHITNGKFYYVVADNRGNPFGDARLFFTKERQGAIVCED